MSLWALSDAERALARDCSEGSSKLCAIDNALAPWLCDSVDRHAGCPISCSMQSVARAASPLHGEFPKRSALCLARQPS